jgi:hypothetical protein
MRMRTQEPVGLELPWGSIAAAAVAAVILGVVWLRPWRPRNPSTADPPVTEQPAPGRAAAQSTAQGAADDAQDAPSTAAPDGAPMAAARATTPTPATTPAASAVPAAPGGGGKAQLRLSFSADSWVDIRDAAGNSIFVGNGRANTVKTVTGEAPLRVYLRTASGVQLAINNRVVAIAPRFFAGDVARFEAGADGVLRRNTHSVSSSAAAHDPRPHG